MNVLVGKLLFLCDTDVQWTNVQFGSDVHIAPNSVSQTMFQVT